MSDLPTVYIVDDDPAVQRGVGIVARSLNCQVRMFGSASDFLMGYQEGAPGCLVLDVRMPEMSGIELQKLLLDAGVSLPVIMMSGHADVPMAVTAMSQGAFNFLEKPFRMPELKSSIEKAIELSITELNRYQTQNGIRVKLNSLTQKEREVLELLLTGLSNKEIASRLSISLRAVEDRRARLMKRMETSSIVKLVSDIRSLPDDAFPGATE
ncbi:MAG: response regulator transcription factor [Planctomycetota bacterium]|jgi:FixJ family two-component response regulator